MKKAPPIFLVSVGPAAGADVLYLDTAYLTGLLKKGSHEYHYIELTEDNLGMTATAVEQIAMEGKGGAIVLLEGRFERYHVIRTFVQRLRTKHPNVSLILWGPMTGADDDRNVCRFLDGTYKSRTGLAGVMARVNECVAAFDPTAPAPGLPAEDPFCLPDYPSMPMDAYIEFYNVSGRHWNIKSSQGCPSGCLFCSRAKGDLLYRDIECLLEEICWLQKNYKIDKFSFVDDNFLYSRRRVRQILAVFRKLAQPISFRFQGRVDRLTESLLIEMKELGLSGISMGIESGSQKILDSLNKKLSVKKIRSTLELLNKHDIPYHGTFIVGAPLESDQSVQDTFNLIQSYFTTNYSIGFLKPLPGTALYNRALLEGKIEDENAYCDRLAVGYDKLLINLTEYDDQVVRQWKQHLETVKETAAGTRLSAKVALKRSARHAGGHLLRDHI